VLALGVLALVVVPSPSGAQPKTRAEQIAEIEKQIAELTRKLNALRNGGAVVPPAPEGEIPAPWIKTLHWRPIGPAAMGGRITALSVFEADPSTYWVATASGGLLKTVNNGTTFEHQFDREATVSIGDVCVAPSNRNIVWVGTGENNPRNSVSYGDGVYKSVDGGKTWKNMGLKKTFQIGRIVVHPTNPDIVYVGALGRLYGPSKDRGLYKTTNGGKTWDRILYIDEKTGIIDIRMHPTDPDTLLVAAWERRRDGFDSHVGTPPSAEGYDGYDPVVKWGKGSGLYKTTDGQHFTKITKGLPTNRLGRLGIDYYRKDPRTVYLIVDCQKIGMGPPPITHFLGVTGENAKGGARLTSITPKAPADKAGLKKDDIIVAVGKKHIARYRDLVAVIVAGKAGDKLTFQVQRGKENKEVTVTLEKRPAPPPQPFAGFNGQDTKGGVKLTQIAPAGPAAKAGLLAGDLILTVDKEKVTTFRQLVTLVRKHKVGDKVQVGILRGKDARAIVITLGKLPVPKPPLRPFGGPSLLGGQFANVQDRQGKNGFEYGGVYKSTDGGDSWVRVNSLNPRPMYFSCIRVDPRDAKYVYVCGINLYRSSNGGKTFSADGGRGVHPDQHALWIDPKDGRHMIVGCDGGFYATYDRMNNWDFLNTVAIGQFYHVAVDSRRPYHVYGGLQDNGSWGGPSHGLRGHGPVNGDWIALFGGDGFVCRVDPNDPDLVYCEIQDGLMVRRHLKKGQYYFIRPRPEQGKSYRFNWNTPFILSSHNPRIFYAGGNYVFRSLNRGEDLRVISPEISLTGRGTATAVAESPRNPDVLYAGTDDGALWVTRDGGKGWTNITSKVGLPGPRWVATIEPSRYQEGRAYVVFDGHRSDDDKPYVYVTEDFGQTWKPLHAKLPWGSTRVLREDIENEDLLYLGTEFGIWASLNRGGRWTKINSNLPTVAVHEIAQHPTAGEIVAATHGRSLWILDVTALRQMKKDALAAKAHLYQPKTVIRWRSQPYKGTLYGAGSRRFIGENPFNGAELYYSLTAKAAKAGIKVLDYTGRTVATLGAAVTPGLHKLSWTTVIGPQPGRGRGGRGRGRRVGGFRLAPPGMYRIVLTVDGKDFTQSLKIEPDPTLPPDKVAQPQSPPAKKKKQELRIDD
jgi:photosystem II stability/assembly factor-like uncharacterized protein